MRNVMRRLAGRYLVLLCVTIAVLTAFQLIIPAAIVALDMPSLIGGVMANLPGGVGAVLAEQLFGGLSATGLLGFGWNHPITHAAGTAVAVVLGARAVAGEIETGTLELVLAQPISRTAYLGAHILFAALALTLLCTAGMLGTLLGARAFHLEGVAAAGIVRVAANYLLLLSGIYAVTLLGSAFGREGGRALGIGFLIAVLSFLVNTVSMLWEKAAFLEPYALHTYYSPRDVLASGRVAPVALIVLGSWTLVCLGLAYWRFVRRDIP